MQAKTQMLREKFWADVPQEELWDRKLVVGFTTIPRTMPLILSIIDALTKNANAGKTYFSLWCRNFDEHIVEVLNPAELASESGFTGNRATYSWRQRMKTLKELGFIDTREGSHDHQFVLLFNPHRVIKKIKDQIPEHLFNQVISRAFDIGAKDMTED